MYIYKLYILYIIYIIIIVICITITSDFCFSHEKNLKCNLILKKKSYFCHFVKRCDYFGSKSYAEVISISLYIYIYILYLYIYIYIYTYIYLNLNPQKFEMYIYESKIKNTFFLHIF